MVKHMQLIDDEGEVWDVEQRPEGGGVRWFTSSGDVLFELEDGIFRVGSDGPVLRKPLGPEPGLYRNGRRVNG